MWPPHLTRKNSFRRVAGAFCLSPRLKTNAPAIRRKGSEAKDKASHKRDRLIAPPFRPAAGSAALQAAGQPIGLAKGCLAERTVARSGRRIEEKAGQSPDLVIPPVRAASGQTRPPADRMTWPRTSPLATNVR